MPRKPSLTPKVRQGLWMIVARSPTLWAAEQQDVEFDKEEREAILAAGRYAVAHFSDGTARVDYGAELQSLDDSERGA